VVVVGGTLAVVGLGLQSAGVAVIGEVPGGLPPLSMPDISWSTLSTLFPIAMAISIVAFMEAISVARFFAQKHRYRIDPSQELVALGLANMGGAFFSGYPVTGGLSRSAVADQAGARTNLAALVTAAAIVLVLVALTPLFHALPKAVLAAIIMVAVMKLFNWREALHLWRTDRVDFGILLLTFATTLGLGIQQGILAGVAASIFVFVARRTRPHYAVLGRIPGERVWRQVQHHPAAVCEPGVLVLRFDVSFYFGNVQFLKDSIHDEIERSSAPIRCVVLEMQGVNALDSSASAMLLVLIEELTAQGVRLHLAATKAPIQHTIEKHARLYEALHGALFLTVEKAVCATTERPPAPSETDATPVQGETNAA
jgi:SulP family sulfate permease